jgi:nucleotide-binding universal stress UspA family protein
MFVPMSPGPILYCYDGSDASEEALRSASPLLHRGEAVILTVWQPLVTRLAESAGFSAFTLVGETEVEADEKERVAAEETLKAAAERARASGLDATARLQEAGGATWETIIAVADEINASLIVCANRGRGAVRTALLGSTSHSVLQHARRPVLIVPEHASDAAD